MCKENHSMNEQKQIEEMAKIVLQEPHIGGLYGFDERIASRLYNAGCRKKSENTVELPCKVGDTIYLPWQYDGVKAVAFLTVKHIIISEHRSCIRTDFCTDDEGFWEQFNGGEFNFSDFGNKVFVSKDEAEKALAKMKGGE